VGVVIKVCESQAKSVRKANPQQRRGEHRGNAERRDAEGNGEREDKKKRRERTLSSPSFLRVFSPVSASLRCIGFSTSK
jgi:hypothetical protein